MENLLKQTGVLIHGRVYHLAPEGIVNASWNRVPCPRCERVIIGYRTVWANQYGYEHEYHCDCSLVFRFIRSSTRGHLVSFLRWDGGLIKRYRPMVIMQLPHYDDDLPF